MWHDNLAQRGEGLDCVDLLSRGPGARPAPAPAAPLDCLGVLQQRGRASSLLSAGAAEFVPHTTAQSENLGVAPTPQGRTQALGELTNTIGGRDNIMEVMKIKVPAGMPKVSDTK